MKWMNGKRGGWGVCPPGSEARRRRRSCSTVARRGGTALMLNRCSLRALRNYNAPPQYPPSIRAAQAHQTIGQHRQNKTRDAYTRRGCLGCVCRQGGKPHRGFFFNTNLFILFFLLGQPAGAGAQVGHGRFASGLTEQASPFPRCAWERLALPRHKTQNGLPRH